MFIASTHIIRARAAIVLWAILFLFLISYSLSAAEPDSARLDNGRQLYLKNCFICHQLNGQGIPGVYPPLAKSDFLSDQERVVRILCEGLSGEITVNEKHYNGMMPPVVLDDNEVADLVTYVLNSWDNSGGETAADSVKEVRSKTSFPTFAALQRANTFAPLPEPPNGFTLREVVRLPEHPVRIASDDQGNVIYVLSENGDVFRVEIESGQFRQIFFAKNYLERKPGDTGSPIFLLGMTMDKQKRLYIASNQPNNSKVPFQNRVTIYRTTATNDGDPTEPKPWFEASYPGNSAYVHGMENIQFGPDGYLYAGNGARTDANQSGNDTNYYQGGEMELTSSIWRLNPNENNPDIDVFARGIRNAYGFCWNEKGEMFATENGPDADAPEELNLIERGKHYGFPYQFGNWTNKAYAHTPDPPPGLKMTLPIANLGPDGGFNGTPLYTFDPHSGPDGIVYLGNDFPPDYRGTFLIVRFGNFLRTPKDNVGFDLLQARLEKNSEGVYQARVKTVLKPLARPIDIHHSGPGKFYIAEYSRITDNQGSYSLPGRILELAVKKN
jgi:glucose/arabinose dehydrogenase